MAPIVFVLALLLGSAKGDYPCLCSYQVQTAIYAEPDENSNVDGYLLESDCKPFYDLPGIDQKFAAIGIENKYGFIVRNSDIQIQKCQGNIPAINLVIPSPPTTTPTSTTTTPSSTPTSTTTSITTTQTSITTAPTTAAKTTSMPTTSPLRTSTAAMSLLGKCLIRLGHPNPTHVSTDGVYCYQFIDTKQTWMHAKEDCARRNGHLLSIDSQGKNDFTYNMLTKIPYVQPVWIGLYDRTAEEKWQWDSGIPATYFNWMPGRFEDQYHNTDDCGVFVHARQGQWDDIDCDGISYDIVLSFPYICQFRI